jgi:CheY-like chemotaxis protein
VETLALEAGQDPVLAGARVLTTDAPRDALPVLIVDHDPHSAAWLAHLVTLLGCRPIRQGGIEGLLARLAGEPVPLLLLAVDDDVALHLLEQIQAQEAGRDERPTAVVAITATPGEAHRLNCLLAGFVDCLARPVQRDALATVVATTRGGRCADLDALPRNDLDRIRTVARRLAGGRGESGFSPSAIEAIALQLDRLVDQLDAPLEAGDAAGITEVTRQTIAICEILGARQLAALALRLQQAAAAGGWREAAAVAAEIRIAHEVVIGLLFESIV